MLPKRRPNPFQAKPNVFFLSLVAETNNAKLADEAELFLIARHETQHHPSPTLPVKGEGAGRFSRGAALCVFGQ